MITVSPAYESEILTVLHVVGSQKTSVFTCTCTLTTLQGVCFGGKCLSAKLLDVTSQKTTIFETFMDFKNAFDINVFLNRKTLMSMHLPRLLGRDFCVLVKRLEANVLMLRDTLCSLCSFLMTEVFRRENPYHYCVSYVTQPSAVLLSLVLLGSQFWSTKLFRYCED